MKGQKKQCEKKVISSETPHKLREIIQDTWPNLYRPPTDFKPSVQLPIDAKCKEV